MAACLFVYRVYVRFARLSDTKDYHGFVDIEVMTMKEAYGLVVSALVSKYPGIDSIVEFKVRSGPLFSIESADDYSRFEVGEEVLVANPVNNMIDPLPAYASWELRKISEVNPVGGPIVWIDEDESIIYYAMAPYGIRKLQFEITG